MDKPSCCYAKTVRGHTLMCWYAYSQWGYSAWEFAHTRRRWGTGESKWKYSVFSKLDLRWGFDQIELEPNSRDVTSCATDDVIFRYKRLSFGVNAAPEKYQHIITQTMAGLKGVANIADDLVVHGKDSEEHDRNLIKVLERLKERGLTVNAEKCTFRMTKVVFMGPLLTRHGIGPTKEKVRAVVEASQ